MNRYKNPFCWAGAAGGGEGDWSGAATGPSERIDAERGNAASKAVASKGIFLFREFMIMKRKSGGHSGLARNTALRTIDRRAPSFFVPFQT
jgi:hypothetical protein